MKTYLFDFDGTLVDSMPVFISSMLRILSDEGISYDQSIVSIITPLGMEGTAEHYIKLGVSKTKSELIASMKAYMKDAYMYTIPAKKHVESVLHILKEQGCHLNVLTASPHETLDPCLKRLGLFDLFDHVWSCDDFHTTKADTNIYMQAASRIGVPVQEVLFLDDNINALQTAKIAGMQVCGVYDDSSKDSIEQIKQITDCYIYDFSELTP